ncbi:unnamed protein product, partial [Choristocarpus tenellus]
VQHTVVEAHEEEVASSITDTNVTPSTQKQRRVTTERRFGNRWSTRQLKQARQSREVAGLNTEEQVMKRKRDDDNSDDPAPNRGNKAPRNRDDESDTNLSDSTYSTSSTGASSMTDPSDDEEVKVHCLLAI